LVAFFRANEPKNLEISSKNRYNRQILVSRIAKTTTAFEKTEKFAPNLVLAKNESPEPSLLPKNLQKVLE
jgi:predicted aspartyl protease